MDDQRRWGADPGRVMSEVLDDEAVIVDLASGHYHAASGVALTVWSAVTGGATLAEATMAVVEHHPGTPDDAGAQIATFVTELEQRGLIEPLEAAGRTGGHVHAGTGPWSPPTLESYDDLEDLLLLDPVHEVTADGWPQATPPAT